MSDNGLDVPDQRREGRRRSHRHRLPHLGRYKNSAAWIEHISSFVVGARPGREHHLQFEKTLGVNDSYLAEAGRPFPLGNVQSLAKLQRETIKPARRWVPLGLLEWVTRRSIDIFVESEDLPLPENRVEVDAAGRIHLTWRATNVESRRELVKLASRAIRRAR
jgi:hypothetical protein